MSPHARRFKISHGSLRSIGLGFDERFIRTLDYYLSIGQAGFDTGLVQDLQILLEKARGID